MPPRGGRIEDRRGTEMISTTAWKRLRIPILVAAVALFTYRFSVSDICGWYLGGREATHTGTAVSEEFPTGEEAEAAACRLSGNVPHCGCSYAAVERMNLNSMRSILSELVRTPFFRYFKTDLMCECPFWPDDGMCSLKDCSVCECDPKELPKTFREADDASMMTCKEVSLESNVDRAIRDDIKLKLEETYRNPWMPEDEENSHLEPSDSSGDEEKSVRPKKKSSLQKQYTYVNLLRNPERYTGYKGEHANRIWKTIYEQPCFDVENQSKSGNNTAHRIFYRIISGIHSSISAHIVSDFLLDEATGTWGPNLPMFQARLGNPDVKDRVENLYFAYLFVLRAVIKAGPVLKGVHYDTGYAKEDAHTARLIGMLVENEMLKNSCPVPFDEGVMWKDAVMSVDASSFARQKLELQTCFQNITRVMDCVGCEKCKVWGKLQFLGVATSLKILSEGDLSLDRNEVIALINLLERLSASVETVRSLSLRIADGDLDASGSGDFGMGAIGGLVKSSSAGYGASSYGNSPLF
jgi:ERO1-like protein alpha